MLRNPIPQKTLYCQRVFESASEVYTIRHTDFYRIKTAFYGACWVAGFGASVATAQTKATTHPISVQPRNRLSTKIATEFVRFRIIAIVVGSK